MITLDSLLREQQTVTAVDVDLLSAPAVKLYFTGNGQDAAALSILDEPGIWFEVAKAENGERIHAEWLDLEMDFSGLEEIKRLAAILTELAPKPTPWLESDTDRFNESHHKLAQLLEKRRLDQRRRAEEFIERLHPTDLT